MRFITAILLLFTASSLGACGGIDGVDVTLPFVGKIDTNAKATEEKMANRGTLVLPPAVKGLPAPTSGAQSANGQSWPVDPDLKAKDDAKVAALKEEKYRKDGDWKGERNSGNGLEEFNNKIDWHRRQPGVFQSTLKQE